MALKSNKKIINSITKIFEKEKSFIIFNHIDPDGDSIGSQLALMQLLRKRRKKVIIYSSQKIPQEFHFLPFFDHLQHKFPDKMDFDVAIAIDAPCMDRISTGSPISLRRTKNLVNIDHHISNDHYGTINWVDPAASSVGEMLFHLLSQWGIKLTRKIAVCLYTSILTDTGGFRFANTTPESLRIASDLLKTGINPADIAKKVYGNYPFSRYKLLSKALNSIRTHYSGKVASIWVTRNMLEQTGATLNDADGFVNFPRAIRNVDVAVIFKEIGMNNDIQIGLRSNKRKIDVNRIAQKFDGGGHATAAGCTLSGTRNSVEKKVLQAVRKELNI